MIILMYRYFYKPHINTYRDPTSKMVSVVEGNLDRLGRCGGSRRRTGETATPAPQAAESAGGASSAASEGESLPVASSSYRFGGSEGSDSLVKAAPL